MIQTSIYDFIEGDNPSFHLVQSLQQELTKTGNRITPAFIDSVLQASTITYHQLTPNMRVCVIKTPTGHEVLGLAQVLDSANDVEEIGNAVALANAKNNLWPVVGSIAKVLI